MKEILAYLKECGTFYLATTEGDQPHNRPFGAVAEHEGKIYIITNNQKEVFKQMLANPKIEITAMNKGTWIRLTAEAVHDSSRDARVAMMNDNKETLSSLYSVDDGLMEVLYLRNATATICSFTEEPKTYTF